MLYKVLRGKARFTNLPKQSAAIVFKLGFYYRYSCQGRSYLDCQAFGSFPKRRFYQQYLSVSQKNLICLREKSVTLTQSLLNFGICLKPKVQT